MPLPISRVRAMPWVMVIQLAMTLHRHWKYLTPGERTKLASLIKKSQGSPAKLTPHERAEVRLLVRKLEPIAIARSVVPIGRKAVGRRR
ncbi:MAG: hypothetical protein QOI73_1791 [Solirubrobacteraceae bacterium]|nr:hypothetical protein [Solirubrobacteraceae bacterium]